MTDLRFLDPEALNNREAFNERFEMLNQLMFGLGNQYLWERLASEIIKTYTLGAKNEQYMCAYKWNGNQGDMIEVSYSSELDIKPGNTASLKEPVSKISVSWNDFSAASVLAGKFFYAALDSGSVQENILVKGSTDGAPAKRPNPSPYIGVYFPAQPVENIKYEEAGKIDYVNSSSPSAYPPAEPDGYTYTALGQLGGRVSVGSYVGTGLYGEANPNKLKLPFSPKFVLILKKKYEATATNPAGGAFILTTQEEYSSFGYWVEVEHHFNPSPAFMSKLNGTELSWYYSGSSSTTTNPMLQLNESGVTYSYIAIS